MSKILYIEKWLKFKIFSKKAITSQNWKVAQYGHNLNIFWLKWPKVPKLNGGPKWNKCQSSHFSICHFGIFIVWELILLTKLISELDSFGCLVGTIGVLSRSTEGVKTVDWVNIGENGMTINHLFWAVAMVTISIIKFISTYFDINMYALTACKVLWPYTERNSSYSNLKFKPFKCYCCSNGKLRVIPAVKSPNRNY